MEEMKKLENNISVESLKNFVKVSKERVKKELGREILIDLPFDQLDKLKEISKVYKESAGTYGCLTDFIAWFSKGDIRIIPKIEDRKIEELFTTFPIRR